MRNSRVVKIGVILYRWQIYPLFGRHYAGTESGRGVDYRLAKVWGMEVAIVLPSNLGPLVKELPFKVIAGTWPSKLFAPQASRKSLVTLAESEPAKRGRAR